MRGISLISLGKEIRDRMLLLLPEKGRGQFCPHKPQWLKSNSKKIIFVSS